MTPSKFLILLLAFTVQVPAATVVYTDNHHPPLNAASAQVVYLDAPDTVQHQIFGELPVDPAQAEQTAKTIIQSPDWQQKQQQIGLAYQGVLQAYSLKLAKYPAVVFDDRYVVYGTTDVAVAEAHLADFQGAQ
ncbi:TIGR03757 family integrating conjugative element protein [Salmonella enterica subsp. houtenae serovar 44:z36,[z38]:-]|uniref:TIGR03757 family integrating conjugative element protein n=1 Tax=Salmonella enterica subsp. houtenae serovar 44:z36[z38]:- TaxID=1967609 RepID=A0A736HZ84_SALHO|nr:TIGR03757 family integrating conjugative element protein [Salmonella enterica]EHM8757085.1 TIGR03757 family integrating conjugative element protein [Salmonella enterica subsp. houtenae serovar 44:z36,[z38]:-]HAE7580878.1 TIGR03757 family integrating conjugative element protein [Salmonella enterica subsp. houtenae serovar 44:z36[z38]:-]HCM6266673.1 TIGR03757 family integrating conjugative element protein [Salmonella enterica subsp. houtenae serovar 44:z36,Z38:-]EGF3877501.1 TIGR03757 family i